MVPLLHLYLTTGKTIALTIWNFVGKLTSLLFNTVYVCHSFSSKEQESFNFMVEVTVCIDLDPRKQSLSLFPIFPCSAFTVVQISYPHMTSGKTIALTIWNFVGKVMSLLFNVLFRFTLLTAIFSYAENGWCIVGSK